MGVSPVRIEDHVPPSGNRSTKNRLPRKQIEKQARTGGTPVPPGMAAILSGTLGRVRLMLTHTGGAAQGSHRNHESCPNNVNAALSARNLADVDTVRVEQLNAFNLLNHRFLIVDKASLQAFVDGSVFVAADTSDPDGKEAA